MQKHAFHLDAPKNVLLLHRGRTQKHTRFSIHQINAPKFLLQSLKVLLQKRGMGYAKVIREKKIKKKKKRGWGQVSEI
jgi:hypothetical protein